MSLKVFRWVLLAAAAAVGLGCGGPDTIDPGPTQNVQAYFAGTDETGDLHIHVHFVQNGRNLVQIAPCPPDHCIIYGYTPAGLTKIGSQFPTNFVSGSGKFDDPGITFTVTNDVGRTFSFTGTVTGSVQMIGTISGPGHPGSKIQLDKQP
jgi:hypothetical protein